MRHQLGWPEDFSGAVDFIIGLVFMAVLPAFLEGVQRIVSDPASLARVLINRKEEAAMLEHLVAFAAVPAFLPRNSCFASWIGVATISTVCSGL